MTGRVALVTGGTGFVGSHLVHELVRDGWQVHVIVRPGSDLSLLGKIKNELVLHEYDGTHESMQANLFAVRPDVVFHLAALFVAGHESKDIMPLIQSNVLFGTHLVEAMTSAGITHLVNTGTFWQHYENNNNSPVNLYAATKQAFEDILQYYVEARGLRVITLKLFDTYGPGDPRPKLLNLLRRVANENSHLKMSPGRQPIDLVHVQDVVSAFVVAAKRLLDGGVIAHDRFGVASGHSVSLRELVDLIGEVRGKELTIKWGGLPYRSREVMVNGSLPSLPGWAPSISLASGLKEFFC